MVARFTCYGPRIDVVQLLAEHSPHCFCYLHRMEDRFNSAPTRKHSPVNEATGAGPTSDFSAISCVSISFLSPLRFLCSEQYNVKLIRFHAKFSMLQNSPEGKLKVKESPLAESHRYALYHLAHNSSPTQRNQAPSRIVYKGTG